MIHTGAVVWYGNRKGSVLGWQGEFAIVELNDGETVTVAQHALRLAR